MKMKHFLPMMLVVPSIIFGASQEPVNNSDRGPCPVTHRFLKGGWASRGIALVDNDLSIVWDHADGDELSDAWYLPDGGVVFSFSNRKQKSAGIKRLDKEQKLVWTYTVDEGRDNHSCQPLPGGRFLAGESAKGAGYMVEIDANGKKVKEVELALPENLKERAVKDIHHVFRHVRKTKEGTFLAACMSLGKAVEWDGQGQFLCEFPDGKFTAVRLPNGNTLVSGKGVTEYNKDKEVVWAMTKEDFEKSNLRISMICGIQRLPNGNTIITNVNHGKLTETGDSYKIIEVTKDKKLVWWVDDPKFAQMQMGSIQAVDVTGDPCNFEVLR